MPFIEVEPDVRVFAQDWGRGKPIVFIHGFPFSHAMWTPQLEAIGKEFRTLAYDVRGHGMSEVGDGQYTVDLFVDDLVDLLRERNIGKAVFTALSIFFASVSFRAAVTVRIRFRFHLNET